MTDYKALILNLLSHLLLVAFLTSFQTSLWYDFFGALTPPFLAIPILVYFTIYRNLKDAFIMSLLTSLLLTNFTIAPHGLSISIFICIVLLLSKLKTRIYWEGPTYYIGITALFTFSFHLFYYLVSWSFEKTGFASVQIIDWLLQTLFTCLISPIIMMTCLFIDKLLGGEQPNPMEENF